MTANCIMSQPAASIHAAPGGKRCLSCRSPFASGGCHEWVCPRCKESETWQAAAKSTPFHLIGKSPDLAVLGFGYADLAEGRTAEEIAATAQGRRVHQPR